MTQNFILDNVAWVFTSQEYVSKEQFERAVFEYGFCNENWEPNFGLNITKIGILLDEVYDENDREFSLEFQLVSDDQFFTNGELLFKLHNFIAKNINQGVSLGSHFYFEGLEKNRIKSNHYNCNLGS